ncbi:MAG: lactate racemase domain-containing protein [Spirochaetes bacterium]|nr:lactate racemase domain-containing protein [Spirochaetota bacterium]
MTYAAHGSPSADITDDELSALVEGVLSRVGMIRRAIVVPPDATRAHSCAGTITDTAARFLGPRLGAVLPALGTHAPMSKPEIRRIFPATPESVFLVHDWRRGCVELGRLEPGFVEAVSGGVTCFDWPAQVNRVLASGGFDLVVSVGQVVPHEVAGMANHAKNLFVGTGGKEAIDKSHWLGAAWGMERLMGMTDNPVRALFDEALSRFGKGLPPLLWMLTVVGRRPDGALALRGFFAGDDRDCFERAAELSRIVNMEVVDEPVHKAVAWLDPAEYRSTWLGNKAIYRLRMAMAEGGELLILAPGVDRFGEDPGIDALIRKYGYRPGPEMRVLVDRSPELAGSLAAAAHLVHGCPEGRFRVAYAPSPSLSREELESVGFGWFDPAIAMARYDPSRMRSGWNPMPDGERVFFVPNPALGLWIDARRYARQRGIRGTAGR